MKKLLSIILVAMAVLILAPEAGRLFVDSAAGQAEARGRGGMGGGMRGGGMHRGGGRNFKASHGGGARRPSGGAHRPSGAHKGKAKRPTEGIRPSKPTRPSQRPTKPKKPQPGKRPPKGDRPKPPGPGAGRPGKPGMGEHAGRPGGKPGVGPGKPGVGPGRPGKPGVGDRPGRPVGNRPGRPPNLRPPVNRPPGWRPPGYRPPHARPPGWRPPAVRPPYVRPPNPYWGRYYWYPRWGWYFTAAVTGGTLAYVLNLPDADPCEEARVDEDTVYVCDGVTYRPTVYRDERVYEIVSSQKDTPPAEGKYEGPMRLTSPLMRGPEVQELQEMLGQWGYSVGTVDGVFGRDTDQALRAYQQDYGLEVNGVLDEETAKALGL